MTVLSDSSPLITLAKTGCLDLLHQLYETVTITPEVYAEIVVAGAGLAGASQVAAAKGIHIQPCGNRTISPLHNRVDVRFGAQASHRKWGLWI